VKKKDENIFPQLKFVGSAKCVSCEENLRPSDHFEIGFQLAGKEKGKLFLRYKCHECGTSGKLTYGSETYTIEKLCSLIIAESEFLSKSQKAVWKERYEK